MLMNNFWLKKTVILAGIFLLVLLFNLNRSAVYQSETAVLILPKNEVVALNFDATVENFRQIMTSLAFNDRLSDGSEALALGVDLPNYKRKEFWNSKIAVTRVGESGVLKIGNFDASSILALELNNDTVDSLITVAGNYYNIKTDLELRIIDGPTVKKIIAKNSLLVVGESMLWALGIYFFVFFLLPFVFIKKEVKERKLPGRDFSREILLSQKPMPAILPEEENYFATKNFFGSVKKTEEAREIKLNKETPASKNTFSLPNFPSFGKKAPTPANLPVSEDEVPDIFRQKEIVPEVKTEMAEPTENAINTEYVPREATEEEVKARLNRLLGGK